MSTPIDVSVPITNDSVINSSPVDQDVEMNNSDDGLSVLDSADVIKDSIRQASAQIAKLTIKLVSPVLSEKEAKKVRTDLALRQQDLRSFKDSLLAMEEVLQFSAPTAPVAMSASPVSTRKEVVPSDLPIIQWVGMVSDNKATVFSDLRTCLSRFEVVVECHGLDLDVHGARLLKYCCLNEDHQTFMKENFFVPGSVSAIWSNVKDAFLRKFGINASVDKSTAANELMAVSKRSSETIEQYIDRFNSLRRRANLNDSCLLVSTFLRGLPDSFQEGMAYTMNMASETQNQNLEYVCAVARNLDSRLAPMRANKRSGDHHKESLDNKRSKVSVGNSSSYFPKGAAASKYASEPSSSSSTRDKKGLFCSFHRTTTHNTEDCKAIKLGGKPKPGPGDCRRCGAKNWTSAHQCDSSAVRVGSSASNLVMRAMSASPERFVSSASASRPANTSVASSAAADITKSPSFAVVAATQRIQELDLDSDEESLLVAAQAQACKYHKRFSLPPKKKSNSLFVPAVIENITTYSLVDSGSSFSMITPEFFNSLVPPVPLVKQEGTIQLGHVENTINRIGSCTLKVFYNKRSFKHTFEVFPFFTHEDVPICFGLDILPRLNIGITGLVSSHFEQTGPKLPDPIDPAQIKPNDNPYGTLTEREPLLDEINKLLQVNSSIDMKNTYCNLPGAVIHLKTKPGSVAYRRQYALPEAYRSAVLDQLETWLQEGVIERAPSHTAWNSPILCVKKKDSLGIYTYATPRVVCDVRLVNQLLIVNDRQQLPLITEIHQRIGAAPIHTILDIHACFTSFKVADEDREKLSFTCPYTNRQFRFVKACFGITFVGSVVQRVLTTLFEDLPYVNVYVDDIVISTFPPLSYHANCVAEVINRLTRANLVLNPDKIVFAQQSIHILGWSLVKGKLIPDPRKVASLETWPKLSTGRHIQQFLGFMNFFRSSIPFFAKLASDLDDLRNVSDITKVWSDKHEKAFTALKHALANAPVISPPVIGKRFHVATDASVTGIGAMLYQVIADEVKFVALASRKLTVSERNYSTTKRELLAVVYAFEKFHKWLYLIPFTLHTDHKSLIYLQTQEIPNALMAGWYEGIFGYTFNTVHLPGFKNLIPDALSRLYTDEDQPINVLEGGSCLDIVALGEIDGIQSKKKSTKGEQKDSKARNKLNLLKQSQSSIYGNNAGTTRNGYASVSSPFSASSSASPLSLTDHSNDNSATIPQQTSNENEDLTLRTLKFADYITPPKDERDDLIFKAHLLGHFGLQSIENQLHHDGVHWTNLRKDIQRILGECTECNRFNISKVGYHPPKSVLPDQPLDHWCMDLCTFDVTSTRGNNFMLVMVDYYSRFTVLRALPDKHSMTIAAELLSIFSLFGFPKILNSDNGAEFTADIVAKMIEMSGIDRRLSLPYSPTGNSVNEAYVGLAKRTIIKELRGKGSDWDYYLNYCQYAMNCKYARLHKSRPYTVLFNKQPNGFNDYSNTKPTLQLEEADTKKIDEKFKFVNEVVIPALSKRIKDTQERDHDRFVKTHKIVTQQFPVGSKVMIKNVTRLSKLDARNLGPFYIHGITKNGSYILRDKSGTLLSRDVPTSHIIFISSDNITTEEYQQLKQDHYEVQAVVDHSGTPGNYLYRVKWKGYPNDEDDTWEPPSHFDAKKPIEIYWGRRNADNQSKSSSKKRKAPITVNTRKIATRNKRSRNNNRS
jgi:transposase InsO family protein